jgi:hypothetical protein
MKLACISVPGRGMTDDLIAEIVERFAAGGPRLAGTVRAGPGDQRGHPCDVDLRVLPDGPIFRISQPLGAGAKGCRLDGGVVETIAAAVEARLTGADLLIVNKFGKQEARGRGLCPAIGMAIEMGIPTIVGVSQMSTPDFRAFSANMAEFLPLELRAVCSWYNRSHALVAA